MAEDREGTQGQLVLLYRMVAAVAQTDSMADLIAVLNGLATEATGAANVAVGVVHRWQKVLDVHQGASGARGTAGIRTVGLDEPSPLTDVVGESRPQLMSSFADLAGRYPWITSRWDPEELQALGTLPLTDDDRTIGAIAFRFDRPTELDGPLFALMAEIATLTSRAVMHLQDRAELEARAASLERSNQDLQSFAAIVAHDLSGPVRRIGSFARLIEREAQSSTGTIARNARQVVDQAVHLDRLLKDVLSYSQVTPGASNREVVRLADLVKAAWGQVVDSHPTIGASVSLQDSLPSLFVQRSLVQQVLVNAFDNSVKYRHPERDVRVAVTAELLRSDDDGTPWWRISIDDNGRGIDSDAVDDAFTIFRRLATDADPGGTGVGLAFVKRVVEHHDGDVGISGRPGQGLTLTFDLPGPPTMDVL